MQATLLLLMALLFVADQTARAEDAPLAVRDSMDREIRLPGPAKRVVALNRDGLELIRAIGGVERVVGAGDIIVKDPEFWGELARVPSVGRWSDPNWEAVARVSPDLILAYVKNPGPEAESKAHAMGATLLRLDAFRPTRFETDLRTLGAVLDRREAAERLIEWRRTAVAKAQACTEGRPRPTLYGESFGDFHGLAPGSGGYELIELTGAAPITSGLDRAYPILSPEWIVERSPDFLYKALSFTDSYSRGDEGRMRAAYEQMRNRPGFGLVPAVRDGNILVLSSELSSGVKSPIGLFHLVRMLHPETCSGLDPDALLAEYLSTFHNLPLKGVYAYGKGVRRDAPGVLP